MFLKADPHTTGTNGGSPFRTESMTRRLSAARIASSGIALPCRYRSRISSLTSLTFSISVSRRAIASARQASGISSTTDSAPSVASLYRIAFMPTRSTTPVNASSAPIGICTATGLACSLVRICSIAAVKSAPTRSILLTKQMRGTPYRSACRQTVSDWGSTPATASNTATAPSSTRSERSTSAVKSTCPGVSMMLIRWSRQKQVVAAEVMVMPRSCSCSIQSITAVPSCTSPSL